MNNKITRRAVLGTTLAALAVAPFVIRALRKGQKGLTVDKDFIAWLDDSKYYKIHGHHKFNADLFEKWKAVYNKFDAVFEADNALDTVTLKTDFSHSRNWHFRNLHTHMIEPVSSLSDCTPQNLSAFELTEGDISIGKGILDISVTNRAHTFLKFIDRDEIKFVTKEPDANGMTVSTLTVENPLGPLMEIKTEQRKIGRIAFKDKDSNGYIRPVNSDGSERKFDIEVLDSYLFDFEILGILLHSFPEHKPLQAGSSFDIPEEVVANGAALPRYTVKSTGKVSGIPSVMFSAEEEPQEKLTILRRTEDVCIDIETGLAVCRKGSMCDMPKSPPGDMGDPGSSQIWVLQVS